MRSVSVAAVLLASGVLAHAQEAINARNWNTGEINLGLFQSDEDTLSSKWLEYRDIPDGITAPFFRFRGDKNGLRYDTPITSDVLGYLSEEEANEALRQIAALPNAEPTVV